MAKKVKLGELVCAEAKPEQGLCLSLCCTDLPSVVHLWADKTQREAGDVLGALKVLNMGSHGVVIFLYFCLVGHG
jgi:hypothetical protein